MFPKAFAPPADRKMLFQAHGIGSQIYVCKANGAEYAWTLKAPDARLEGPNGQAIGRHFAGPTWEAKDGSRVVGKAAVTVPSPDADSIPWLLVDAIRHEGDGVMTPVVTIQRLRTKGGKAPAAGCDSQNAGKEAPVPYEADYIFFGR